MSEVRWIVGLPVVLALLACNLVEGEGAQGGPAGMDQLAVVRVTRWPGGGRELTVRAQARFALPLRSDISQDLQFTWADGRRAELSAQPVVLAPGFTALLVRPQWEASSRAALVEGIKRFVDARPPGERIALYLWGKQVEPLGNYSADRERLYRLAERLLWVGGDEAPASSLVAVATVQGQLGAIGGAAPRVMRAVVVLGREVTPTTPRASAVPVLYADTANQGPTEVLLEASQVINEVAATSYYSVAVCGSDTTSLGTLAAAGLVGEVQVALPATLPEEVATGCNPDQIGPGLRTFTPSLELRFSPEQRAVYDNRVAELSKEDFDLGVVLRAGTEPVAATAHLRGHGSLACGRKNYTVRLHGPGRHLLPGSRTDEFYLLSMCGEDRYVEQYTANQLMAELGLFPLAFRYVELVLDEQTRGVYLLMEKVPEELQRDNAQVRSVLRRRFTPPEDFIEVKKARVGGADAVVAAYEEFLASLQGLQGQALIDALEARLDVTGYLRWVALMTAFQNGDFVDELWLVSGESMSANGQAVDWYEPVAWDNDDLFSDCHYAGAHALQDPNELLYCVESSLDRVIFAEPLLYERYVDILEALLEQEVTPARFDAAVEVTADRLLPYFERTEICAAMTELVHANPGAVEPVEAQRDVRQRLDELRSHYAARHAFLLWRIESYRSGGEPQ